MYRIYDKEDGQYLRRNNRFFVSQKGEVVIEDRFGYELNINQQNYIIELSTGIKDINGVELYVGDRVKDKNDNEFDIIFREDRFCFDNCIEYIDLRFSHFYKLEKIGTIHDKED